MINNIMIKNMSKTRYISLIVSLTMLGLTLLATPEIIQALPGRYAYYLPEPLQELRHNPHPDVLPTPVVTHVPPTMTPISLPTPTPTPSPTVPPPTGTRAPTSTPQPSSTPTPTPPARCVLTGVEHEHQGWNNCGPVTLAMAISYWDRTEGQFDIAPVLKPDPEDKNVSPHEMAAYARDLGLGATVRVNGTLKQLKSLLRAGFPVIVETWYVRDAEDQLGHYRLVIGYDDEAQQFITYDSLHGPDVMLGYQEMDELWRVFNRLYLVVYEPERANALMTLIGDEIDEAEMYEQALARAQNEAANPPETCVAYVDCADWLTFSWFNIGANLTSLGRHTEAAPAYDWARQLGLHYRMLWYQFGPYESYYAVGRYDDVIALADATLSTANNLEESYYWRGMARLAKGDAAGARDDFEAALRYHEGWPPAANALANLNDN